MVEFLVEGKTVQHLAEALKVSYSTMRAVKNSLALKLLEFMGTDILIQVQRLPEWKNNLEANKERMACRQERNH